MAGWSKGMCGVGTVIVALMLLTPAHAQFTEVQPPRAGAVPFSSCFEDGRWQVIFELQSYDSDPVRFHGTFGGQPLDIRPNPLPPYGKAKLDRNYPPDAPDLEWKIRLTTDRPNSVQDLSGTIKLGHCIVTTTTTASTAPPPSGVPISNIPVIVPSTPVPTTPKPTAAPTTTSTAVATTTTVPTTTTTADTTTTTTTVASTTTTTRAPGTTVPATGGVPTARTDEQASAAPAVEPTASSTPFVLGGMVAIVAAAGVAGGAWRARRRDPRPAGE